MEIVHKFFCAEGGGTGLSIRKPYGFRLKFPEWWQLKARWTFAEKNNDLNNRIGSCGNSRRLTKLSSVSLGMPK